MISLEGVSRSFGRTRAVDDLSLSAGEGEIFGMLGPNGAGKTTTIRMIMGILAPDSGRISYNGRPLRSEDTDDIGYLPEERGLYRKVRVADMLRHLGELKNAPRSECEQAMDGWLERFGLTEWKQSRINELSKGMAQKVQFIGSLIHDPKIVILDEPFSGLDPVSVDTLREAIVELRSRGKTIFFSTHVMEQAERLCDRIVLINKGRSVISGPLEELQTTYGSRAVTAEFDAELDPEFVPAGTRVRTRYPRSLELQLEEGTETGKVLDELRGRGTLRRFEVARPSLHSIFVDLVKGETGDA
jgi:ABC-2 type transport system ATP-binding protein